MAYYTALGNTGGADEPPTLLWTNQNTASAFAAQTVSLDLSTYKSICIDYRVSISGTERHTYAFYSVGDNITIPSTAQGYPTFIGGSYGSQTGLYSTARDISIATNGITFGYGYTSTQGRNNNYAIPAKIYGIKAQIYPSST